MPARANLSGCLRSCCWSKEPLFGEAACFSWRSHHSEDAEDGVFGRCALELFVACVRADAFEELADLPFPLPQVRPQDVDLFVPGDLDHLDWLASRPEPELTFATHADVLHPIRDAARRDEIALAAIFQQVHRRCPPLSTASAADG